MNNPSVTSFDGIPIQLSNEILGYLAGVPKNEYWEARGLSLHGKDEEAERAYNHRRKAAVENLLNSSEGRRTIQSFHKECKQLLRKILLNQFDAVHEEVGHKEYIFICGLHRSGGVYLINELSRIYDFNYQQYHGMHDDVPDFFQMLYWKNPYHMLNHCYQLAQWLVMVKHVVRETVVVKKRALWPFALPLFAPLFKKRAIIYVHVRHPISWALADTQMRDGKEATEISCVPSVRPYVEQNALKLPPEPQPLDHMLNFWRLFHEACVQTPMQLVPLPYGQYEEHLKNVAAKHIPDYKPEPFHLSNRDLSQYAPWFEKADALQRYMQTYWVQRNQAFPTCESM